MVVAAPRPKPWLLTQNEVTILKNAVCKGATDKEMEFCLAVARRYELDPFQQQIWFVPRWDSEAEQSDGKKGGKVFVPQVALNGLLHVAARDHADFGTYSEPKYGPMVEISWADQYGKKGKFMAPEWCRIEVWKKGSAQPTVAIVWWEEIYPDVSRAPLVRRMPRLMLAKCAKAQATRTSYPKTGGLLIPEETQTREFQDITPEGRIISSKQEVAESNWDKREAEGMEKLNQTQKGIVTKKIEESASRKVNIHSFPDKEDGDCEIKADAATAAILSLKRAHLNKPGMWLVKWSVLPQFYDLCRDKSVTVTEENTDA
jgi:hypothetical protein